MSAVPQPIERVPPPQEPHPPTVRQVTVGVWVIVATLNAVGLLLVVRRLVGALTIDLPMGPLLATALVAGTAAKFARHAWRNAHGRPMGRRAVSGDRLVGWGASLGLALLAVGCCYPGDRNSEWLVWLPMLIADQFWRQNFFDNGQPGLSLADLPYDDLPDNELAEHHASDLPPEQLLQQLFRVRNADGSEAIYGTVHAEFAAGQRHATVHVGFCPPLASTPQIEAAACDWPEARVKVAQALAHGVRLDVRLSEPAEEPCQAPIDLAAVPPSAR